MSGYAQLITGVVSLAILILSHWLENAPERKKEKADAINQDFAKALYKRDTDTVAVMWDERLRGVR